MALNVDHSSALQFAAAYKLNGKKIAFRFVRIMMRYLLASFVVSCFDKKKMLKLFSRDREPMFCLCVPATRPCHILCIITSIIHYQILYTLHIYYTSYNNFASFHLLYIRRHIINCNKFLRFSILFLQLVCASYAVTGRTLRSPQMENEFRHIKTPKVFAEFGCRLSGF